MRDAFMACALVTPGSSEAGISSGEANRIAERWISAWNRRDLDEILALYAEDAIQIPATGGAAVSGRDAIRQHLRRALAGWPGLRYQLYHVAMGRDGLVLVHRGADGRIAAEVLTLDREGRIRRAASHVAAG